MAGVINQALTVPVGFNQEVETAKVYRLEGVGKKEAKFLAEKLFSEKINQRYALNNSTEKLT